MGDKQVAEVGPHGETLLDFTAFDARRCGFVEAGVRPNYYRRQGRSEDAVVMRRDPMP